MIKCEPRHYNGIVVMNNAKAWQLKAALDSEFNLNSGIEGEGDNSSVVVRENNIEFDLIHLSRLSALLTKMKLSSIAFKRSGAVVRLTIK